MAVIDIPVDRLDSLISRVDREVGFQIEPHHAALLGLCATAAQPCGSAIGMQT
jgi:Fe2+ or Zn2+ uptake regulation protein